MRTDKNKRQEVNSRKTLKDVLHITKISDRQLNNLLSKMNIVIFAGAIEEEILYDDYRKIIYHKHIKQLSKIAAFYGVRRIKNEKLGGSHLKFESECKTLIEDYERIIAEVMDIHFSNLKRLDLFIEETPVVAAYTLFAKSLNLLNMICLNLKHGYLNCLMLFRPLPAHPRRIRDIVQRIGFVCPNFVIAFLSDENWRAFISLGFHQLGTHSFIFTVLICSFNFFIRL